MVRALHEARQALTHGDVPVGAVLADQTGEILAVAHNEKELRGDPTAHAEILALRSAAQTLGTWRLDGFWLATTLEPCIMCAGALVAARVHRVIYGANDLKAGACGSLYNVCDDPRLNHRLQIVAGVEEMQCGELLTGFFDSARNLR